MIRRFTNGGALPAGARARWWLAAIAVLLGGLVSIPAPVRSADAPAKEAKAADKKSDDKKSDDKKSDPKGKESGEGKKKKKKKKQPAVDRLEVPIPVHHDAGGIKLPDYDKDGRLHMVLQIGSAFRVNEDELQMSNLRIETFDKEGKPETEISMESALLNLISREIVSEKPVTIRRTGFEITGGHLTFQGKERSGVFKGPVKVLVFNRDNFDDTKKKEGHEDTGTVQ